MTTHAELVAAAEKARLDVSPLAPWPGQLVGGERNRHIDDLLAILRLHPHSEGRVMETCRTCTDWADRSDGAPFDVNWPCLTVQIVADRLRGWGALNG